MDLLEELRRESRKPVNISIEFKSRKRKTLKCTTRNLSIGGMFVATKEPLKVSERTFFTIKPTTKPFSFNFEGEVVWNNGRGCKTNRRDLPTGMGVKFIGRSLKRDTMENFVNFIETSDFRLCL